MVKIPPSVSTTLVLSGVFINCYLYYNEEGILCAIYDANMTEVQIVHHTSPENTIKIHGVTKLAYGIRKDSRYLKMPLHTSDCSLAIVCLYLECNHSFIVTNRLLLTDRTKLFVNGSYNNFEAQNLAMRLFECKIAGEQNHVAFDLHSIASDVNITVEGSNCNFGPLAVLGDNYSCVRSYDKTATVRLRISYQPIERTFEFWRSMSQNNIIQCICYGESNVRQVAAGFESWNFNGSLESINFTERNLEAPDLMELQSDEDIENKEPLSPIHMRMLCCVCQEHISNCLMSSCSHQCVCEECFNSMTQARKGDNPTIQCPYCNQTQNEPMRKIYVVS